MAPALQDGATAQGDGSFLRKAGPLVIARFVAAILSISIPLVLARRFELADYGSYKQLILIFQTMAMVLPFGVSQSLYYFVPRNQEHARTYFGQAMVWLFAMALVACSLLFLFQDDVARLLNNPKILAYRWELAIYSAGLVGSAPLELWFTTRGKTKLSAVSYLTSDTLRALALVLPVLLGYGLRGAMVASAAFALLRFGACWTVLLRARGGPIFTRRLFVTQLVYAAPFGAAMLLAFPQASAHQYAVSASVTPELFAIYAVGIFQLPLVDLFYTPTSEVLMVRIGELDRLRRLELALGAFREAASKLAFLFLPLAAFLFAAAPEFIAALFGERFLGAVPIFRVSVWGIALAVLPMDGALRARNKTRHIFWSYLVKAVVTVPLVYFLVREHGMLGGVWAWLLAEVAGKAMLLAGVPSALSSPERRRSLREVIPWLKLLQAGVAACTAAGLVVLARRMVPPGAAALLPQSEIWRVIPLALAGILFSAGYVIVLWAQGVRPMTVFSMLRRRGAA